MRKGFTAPQLLLFLFMIISLIFVTTAYAAFSDSKMNAYKSASRELGKLYVMNKLITSKKCISTGETGVLNRTLLDEVDGLGELYCAYLPDYTHYVRVDDMTNGEGWDWEFGYEGSTDWQDDVEFYGSVRGDYTTIPARIMVTVSTKDPSVHGEGDDLIICMVGAAERAWKLGEKRKTCRVSGKVIGDKNIHFYDDKICLEETDGTEIRCKSLNEAHIEDVAGLRKSDEDQCTVKFVKTGAILSVEEFSCEEKVDSDWYD